MRIRTKQRTGWRIAGLLLAAIAFLAPRPTLAQFTHVGDVKIDGGLAIGFDTASSTSFGFDTMILRENNLRVLFDDTSVAAAFPQNDWRLTANDSANGGSSYFAIEDASAGRQVFRVNAGARSNALFVDSQGDVGLGTSTPALDIDIKTGDTPSIRLQQDGTSGFEPQTWDLAGNEAGFFVRDATSGSTLPFRVRAGAPSSAVDIQSDGDVGVGTSSPSADINPGAADEDASLHIRRTDRAATLFVESTGTASAAVRFEATNATTQQARLDLANALLEYRFINNGNRVQWFDVTNNNEVMTLRNSVVGIRNNNPGFPLEIGTDATNGNGAHVTIAGIFTNGSTRKSKERIVDLDGEAALAAFDKLNPVTYYGKNQDDEQYVGFIADDVPELVAMNDRSGIAAIEIAALLTKVVQEQRETITRLAKRVESLEAEQADAP